MSTQEETKPTTAEFIHWRGTPEGVCERKDSKADSRSVVQGRTTITYSGEAGFIGNVTCTTCRRYARSQR
jgi:hypothetical protein